MKKITILEALIRYCNSHTSLSCSGDVMENDIKKNLGVSIHYISPNSIESFLSISRKRETVKRNPELATPYVIFRASDVSVESTILSREDNILFEYLKDCTTGKHDFSLNDKIESKAVVHNSV